MSDEKFSRRWFTKRIVSSKGFAVERLWPVGLWYEEQGRRMFVDSEVQAVPNLIMVMPKSIKRWQHEDAREVDETERRRIFDNIRRALEWYGYAVETPQGSV